MQHFLWLCYIILFILLAKQGIQFPLLLSYNHKHVRRVRDLVIHVNLEDSRDYFDSAIVYVKGGSGGQGSNAFRFGKARQHVAPYGGSGGDGGSVYFCIDRNLNTLRKFRNGHSFHAENGHPGDKEFRNGPYGADLFVTVPAGTLVFDNRTNELLAEVALPTPKFKIAAGGKGGRGNAANRNKGEKAGCLSPEKGERRWLRLELKLLADVGLIGVPNAGKSTLLKAITNANPKIADYAFTTIVPNLGVCFVDDDPSNTFIVADIPGLIEGAHEGIGLGKDFLKHVEKCRVLIHVVDGSSKDPIQEYLTINKELTLYSKNIALKPQIVVINKIDLPEVQEKLPSLMESFEKIMPHKRLLTISAANRVDVGLLKFKVWNFYSKVKADEVDEGN